MYLSRGLFLWMGQRKSRFRNLKWVDGTTQELVSGAFRGCKFRVCLVAKYFISENSGSCSHINFVQKVEEELILCCFLVSPLELRWSTWWTWISEYRMRLLPGLLPRDKQAGASLRECTWMNLVFISFCTGLKVAGAIFGTWQCY